MWEILLSILFVVVMVSCVFGFVYEGYYLNYIKQKYPEIWIRLGEPQLFYNMSMKIGDNIKKFESQDYLSLHDLKLEKMIHFKKSFSRIYLVVFISCVGIILLVQLHVLK